MRFRRDPLPAEAAIAAADQVVQRLLELPEDTGARRFYARMVLAGIEERIFPAAGAARFCGGS